MLRRCYSFSRKAWEMSRKAEFEAWSPKCGCHANTQNIKCVTDDDDDDDDVPRQGPHPN